jgi:hypothetical protein
MSEWHRLAFVCQPLGIAPVIVLLNTRGPSHISWLVVAVIVLAINGVFHGRSGTDVFQEGQERLAPAITHADTSPAIVRIGWIGRALASRYDSAPNDIFGSQASIDALTMRAALNGCRFAAPAPARGGVSAEEVAIQSHSLYATRAPASHEDSVFPVPSGVFEYRPATEHIANLGVGHSESIRQLQMAAPMIVRI